MVMSSRPAHLGAPDLGKDPIRSDADRGIVPLFREHIVAAVDCGRRVARKCGSVRLLPSEFWGWDLRQIGPAEATDGKFTDDTLGEFLLTLSELGALVFEACKDDNMRLYLPTLHSYHRNIILRCRLELRQTMKAWHLRKFNDVLCSGDAATGSPRPHARCPISSSSLVFWSRGMTSFGEARGV